MTALFAYRRRRPMLDLARAAVLLAAAVSAPAHAADTITVVLDQAAITKLPEHVSTIVIGNPLIADVTVQAGGLLVVTGKGYGTTNLIALDRSGAVLTERNIQVLSPQDKVVFVYRGVNRESYSCAPDCERRITLGDTKEYFDETLRQTGTRTAQAQGQAAASAAPR
jgi:Flp pilus assembly secretin CpaC